MKIEDYVHGVTGLTKAALKIRRATLETITIRKEICSHCTHKNEGFNKLLGGMVDRCGLCKCVINAKVLLKDEECPDHPAKWGKE
jgi:ABC-type proline/glycine betaine transport system ATPase subunit